jgi:hypothetical protein
MFELLDFLDDLEDVKAGLYPFQTIGVEVLRHHLSRVEVISAFVPTTAAQPL